MEEKVKASRKELFYDSFSEKWESKINVKETNKRLEVVFNILLRDISLKNKKLLEVGCGLGYFSKKAHERGARVMGVDVGKNLISICRKKIPKGKFLVASALNLPFEEGAFDIVLCTEVIEHVENPTKAIKELARVTKKGGYFLVTTPNKLFKPLFSVLSSLRIRPYHGNERWMFPSELRKKLIFNKNEIVKETHFNFIYPNKFFDFFEKYTCLKKFMINQGYLVMKK